MSNAIPHNHMDEQHQAGIRRLHLAVDRPGARTVPRAYPISWDYKYCQPCPNNVAIPRTFDLNNTAIMYNAPDRARWAYEQWVRGEARASYFPECGECEAKCPQGIEIIEWLGKADRYLTAEKSCSGG